MNREIVAYRLMGYRIPDEAVRVEWIGLSGYITPPGSRHTHAGNCVGWAWKGQYLPTSPYTRTVWDCLPPHTRPITTWETDLKEVLKPIDAT